MVQKSELPNVLIIGPTPPPFHGVSVAMESVLQSNVCERFNMLHVDTSDRRGIQHVDQPDWHDVVLFLRQWVRLLALLVRHRPAAAYLPVSQSTVGFLRDSFFIWPAWTAGARIVLHLHGAHFRQWYEGRSFLVKTYVKIVLGRVSRMVVLGDSLRLLFEELMDSSRVAVIPNGIDWPPIGRRASRRRRVLHLSTLSRAKGALVLLEAARLVLKVRDDVEFVLAGPWLHQREQQEAETFVTRYGLSPHVSLEGPVESMQHKRSIFASADVFVFAGLQQEGQPLVVIEAMASGIPVLFTDRGCLRDTVKDGECGLEVHLDDPAHLADRLLWCLHHPEEIARMGRNGRDRYERHYTVQQFVEQLANLFAETISSESHTERVDQDKRSNTSGPQSEQPTLCRQDGWKRRDRR